MTSEMCKTQEEWIYTKCASAFTNQNMETVQGYDRIAAKSLERPERCVGAWFSPWLRATPLPKRNQTEQEARSACIATIFAKTLVYQTFRLTRTRSCAATWRVVLKDLKGCEFGKYDERKFVRSKHSSRKEASGIQKSKSELSKEKRGLKRSIASSQDLRRPRRG
jgi:hypothetical protein